MEEEEKELKQPGETTEQAKTKVGFPEAPEKKSGFNFKIFFILLIVLLAIGGGAWYLFGRSNQEIVSDKPTPTSEEPIADEATSTPTEAKIDRDGIKIQILNGTGISGAAGDLENDLKKLGYSDFKTGNADDYSHSSTEVSFGSSVSDAVKKEIKSELAIIYESVNEGSSPSTGYDVTIVTGYVKGYTPTPTSKPKATATTTPEPTGTVTPTP